MRPGDTRVEHNLAWRCAEVVYDQNGVLPPVVAHGEDLRRAGADQGEITPADLRHLLAHTNHAFSPVQQGVRVAPLRRDIHMRETVGPTRDHRRDRLVVPGEAAM